MTQLQHHVSLRPYNTFGLNVQAAQLLALEDRAQLPEVLAMAGNRLVLGSGSNVLFTGHVAGLVLLNRLKGITIEKENGDHTWVRVQAGELWHDLVLFAIGNNLGGIENLALIPGTTGASPIQNIGAYGVEVRETIVEVEGWHWQNQAFLTLSNAECCFGYRDSIFKHALKEKVLITSVLFKLSKHPELRTGYGAVMQELEAMQLEPSVQNIAQAVINIRRSKLPDPAVVGNAGSFFKNPTIPLAQYQALLGEYAGMPSYPVSGALVKVPAGWLIEQCGLKGFRRGDAGVHTKQALVLVNYGNATGTEIWVLSTEVIDAVWAKFGIMLEREVQVIPA
jgi:UDP-N-acetylmuramate dehydrogenase